jgi:hypothetical protein
MDVKGSWQPLWYVEWGGRGWRRYGAPLLAVLVPLWGKRRIDFRIDLPYRETWAEQMTRQNAEYYEVMRPKDGE